MIKKFVAAIKWILKRGRICRFFANFMVGFRFRTIDKEENVSQGNEIGAGTYFEHAFDSNIDDNHDGKRKI